MSFEQLYILKRTGQSYITMSEGTDSTAKPLNFLSREWEATRINRGSWKRSCGLDMGRVSHAAYCSRRGRSPSYIQAHVVHRRDFSNAVISIPIHFITSSDI